MRKFFVFLAMASLLVATACGKNAAPSPPNKTPGASPSTNPNAGASPSPSPTAGGGTTGGVSPGTTTVDAQAIYKQNCVSCHGDQLQGMVGPNLMKVGAKYSRDQLVQIISNGRGGMPAFKGRIPDPHIAAIADWLGTHK